MIIPIYGTWVVDTATGNVIQAAPDGTPKPSAQQVQDAINFNMTTYAAETKKVPSDIQKYLPWALAGGLILFLLLRKKGRK